MHRSRNNVLAGLLVIVAVIGTVIAVVLLGGAMEAIGRASYIVRFDISTGVGGLQQGADVQVGGIDVGSVSSVRLVDRAVEVKVRIDDDIELREGAIAELQLALLGGQGVVNFPTLGDGEIIQPGDSIEGRLAPPGFLAQAGVGEEQVAKIRNIIDDVSRFSSSMGEHGPAIMTDARELLADAREQWNLWKPRFDGVLADVEAAAEGMPNLVENYDLRADQAREFLATAQGYLDENRDDVRSFTRSAASVGEEAETFMAELNGELTERMKTLMEQGQSALERAENVLVDADNLLAESKPEVRKSLANFRLASDQLRDTLLEVRQAPWRLLYRPDTRELNFELLYDAARSYAGAVSDLQAASASLEAYGANIDDPTLARTAEVEDLIGRIDDAFTRYQQAEETFLDVLLQQAGEE